MAVIVAAAIVATAPISATVMGSVHPRRFLPPEFG
jgi:hypothetical protein